ncbi:MAG: CpsD/CapB family tyrosine-protein kinase [Oscillospiraceae bacterium]
MKIIKLLRSGIAQMTRKRQLSQQNDLITQRDNILAAKSDFYIREAYKTLRTNVTFSTTVEGCKVIAVTSAMASEGKSITTLNLAISFAETGARVLLIDGDLRRPSIARLMEMNAKPGLSNVLVKLSDLRQTVRHSERSGLELLLSGDIPPNPTELLGSERMRLLLEELRATYDYIFVDTPPVNVVADISILSRWMDGILFVVRAGESERDPVVSAVSQLEFAGAKLLGFVMNGANSSTGGRYSYQKYHYKKHKKYSYGVGYEYAAHADKPAGEGKTPPKSGEHD